MSQPAALRAALFQAGLLPLAQAGFAYADQARPIQLPAVSFREISLEPPVGHVASQADIFRRGQAASMTHNSRRMAPVRSR